MAGRRNGNYSHAYRSETSGNKNFLLRILLDEIDRDFARKVAAKVNKPAHDPGYTEVAKILKVYKQDHFHRKIINEIKRGDFKF